MRKTEEPKIEIPDEFDFYANPLVKGILKSLRSKLDALPEDERLYEVENYAVRRGLRNGAQVRVIGDDKSGKPLPAKGQKIPEGGQVVDPAYARLLNCYKWLQKLEEKELGRPESKELPF